jgi:hypothetical protein
MRLLRVKRTGNRRMLLPPPRCSGRAGEGLGDTYALFSDAFGASAPNASEKGGNAPDETETGTMCAPRGCRHLPHRMGKTPLPSMTLRSHCRRGSGRCPLPMFSTPSIAWTALPTPARGVSGGGACAPVLRRDRSYWNGNRTRDTRINSPMLYPTELSSGRTDRIRTGDLRTSRRSTRLSYVPLRQTTSNDPRHTPRQCRAHRMGHDTLNVPRNPNRCEPSILVCPLPSVSAGQFVAALPR